jgi:hypothetical protein
MRKHRTFAIVCFGVLLLPLLPLIWLYAVCAKPIGNGPAGPQPPREAFAKP